MSNYHRCQSGVEGEFFVQLFLESEANSDAVPNIRGMLQRPSRIGGYAKVGLRPTSILLHVLM